MKLWVVEMVWKGKWSPTVGVALSRREGQQVLKSWKKENPDDKFRLQKYTPQ